MATSDARIDLRIKPDIKELFSKAAQLAGTNLSSFVISSTMEKAQQVIEDQELLRLSNRDRDAFLDALDNPPAPNEALQRAARRYEENGFS